MTQTSPPARAAHHAVVAAVTALTPHMKRIRFEGEALATMEAPLPAQWLKVVLAGPQGANRAYTIRHFYPSSCAMDIDFVLHGDSGPASAWAARAKTGDAVRLGAPRGGFSLDPAVRWRLVAGDETALPAIATILEALPPDEACRTLVAIEVPSVADVQRIPQTDATEIHWLSREGQAQNPGSLLASCIARLPLPSGPGQVFLAGEATAIRTIKTDLAGRVPEAQIDAKGYWRSGHADHRDT